MPTIDTNYRCHTKAVEFVSQLLGVYFTLLVINSFKSQTHAHTYSQMHSLMHTHTHARTHTHIHTNTQTRSAQNQL